MTLSRVVVVLVLGVLLAGCTGSARAPSSDRPSASGSSGSPSATPTPPVVPAAPKAGACYRLRPAQLTTPSNGSPPVSCRGRHTARTVFVGRLDTVVDGHAVAVDSAHVQRQLATVCPRKMAAYLGGTRSTRDLSRFNVVWYSPSLGQSDRGAEWFRCDVIAFGRGEQLAQLPRGAALQGALSRPQALARFGLCGTAAPGAPGFQRVICAQRHSWRAFATIGLRGGRAYPGPAVVREAGNDECRTRARALAPDALRFRYGWEWPTRAQWGAGQRFGFCWVPA